VQRKGARGRLSWTLTLGEPLRNIPWTLTSGGTPRNLVPLDDVRAGGRLSLWAGAPPDTMNASAVPLIELATVDQHLSQPAVADPRFIAYR
jgi:hypothetical protein